MQESGRTVKPFGRDFQPYFTYREQAILRQWIERYWMPFLTPPEFKVLSVIVSRTVAWGKLWETIPLRHFTEGAALKRREQAGDALLTARAFRGTGMCRNAVKAALRGLEGQGFIRSKPHRDTSRYAVNWSDMGSTRDPVLTRFDADAEATELQAELAKVRRRQEAEGGSPNDPLSIEQHHSLRSLSFSTIVENSTALTRACPEQTIASNEEQDMPFPTPRPKKPTTVVEGDSPAEDWRSREQRVAGRVAGDEADREVIHAARSRVRVATPSAPGALSAAPQDTSALIVNTLQESEAKRSAKIHAGKETVDKAWSAWSVAFQRVTNRPATMFKAKHRGQIGNIIKSPLPDPKMRWSALIEWVAERYGEAVGLAVPFMLRDPAKRAEILHAPPSITLFIAFYDHFAMAMAASRFGEGITPDKQSVADSAQREHARWMARRENAAADGHENLRAENRTADELVDYAAQEAQRDPELAKLMAQRAALRAMHDATRGDGAARVARADAVVVRERTRIKVKEGEATRDIEADKLGIRVYSENPDDYYNAE